MKITEGEIKLIFEAVTGVSPVVRAVKLDNSEVVHLFPRGRKFALGFDELGNLRLYKVEEVE